MRHALVAAMATIALSAPNAAWSWGFKGHEVVGEIADQVIARDHPELKEALAVLLDGKSLRQVATYPDCLLFSCDPTMAAPFAAFKKRNPNSDKYHFTDVPIERKRYAAGTGGTHPHDVVQVLRYAVGLLRGTPPVDVPANLERDEAVWIIAHMVGDIHQPLHVGSIYFDDKCDARVDPNQRGAGLPDFGIGTKVAETHGGGWLKIPHNRQLHKLWDNEAVDGAMRLAGVTVGANPDGSIPKFAATVLANPPTGWQTPGDARTWSRRWADEILPLAREAHDRIRVETPGTDQIASHDKVECRWNISLNEGYDEWAAARAREQLGKAGFRLAAILRMLLVDEDN